VPVSADLSFIVLIGAVASIAVVAQTATLPQKKADFDVAGRAGRDSRRDRHRGRREMFERFRQRMPA